jgi:hypothetical protein
MLQPVATETRAYSKRIMTPAQIRMLELIRLVADESPTHEAMGYFYHRIQGNTTPIVKALFTGFANFHWGIYDVYHMAMFYTDPCPDNWSLDSLEELTNQLIDWEIQVECDYERPREHDRVARCEAREQCGLKDKPSGAWTKDEGDAFQAAYDAILHRTLKEFNTKQEANPAKAEGK